MELPQSLNLYITFIEKEGPFLKVWGQTEKHNAIYVEQFLSGISVQFNAGLSKVSPESLQCGTLVCAKYEDNKYYRARLLNIFIRENIVEVTFIDFGNRHIISCENIRGLQDCPSSFISIPPLAVGFIFAEAHCVGGGEWNDTIFESISKEFRFREVQCHLLSQATQYYLVKLYVDTTDLCSLLIQRGLMQPISLQAQQAVLLSMSIQRQTAQAPTTTPTAAAINTYKAVTLEPGCLYPVYVSYINDGPCHFSVQLKQSEDILAKLMKDINCVTLRLLEDVPIPGTLCLARCQEDGNVCRAVVTNEVDNQFKVYYVDFGNYEIVSLDSLFQIPFKYVIPKVMAIRYSLAGVEKSTVTIEMQVAFKKFVDNRMLHMKVLPTLTRVAVPKCELWDPENKTSALEVVNRAAQHAYPEPMPLNRGFSQSVKVSFVYSCNRFYVQLVSKEKELSNLMLELQEICQTSSPIEASDIKTGLPCCALFLADSLWYRSQVVEVLGENIKVRYIDFGNEEDVHISLLKTIDGEQLTVLRPQAIECCLNGYQNMGDDPERDGLLEEIILEDTFTMKVVEMFGKKVLVELFDLSNYNVASLLLDKIAAAKSQASPMLVQAGNKIEHRKSFSQQREGQTPHREGYSQHREGQRDDHRGDRDIKTGRDDSNWTSKPNDRSEKPWRQDNRESRSYDKNSNDNDERNSWRDNNKGFSPSHQRQNRQRSQEGDSWNPSNNDANSNSWNTIENSGNTNTDTLTNDEWNSPSNDDGVKQNRRQDDYGKNRRGFDNDRGSKYDNDRGSKYDNDRGSKYDNDRGSKYDNDRGSKFDNDRGDRYAGKKWDGGYGKKPDFRKDDSQLSPNDSDHGYHKGPRTSSRNDRGGRGGKFERNYDKPRGASFNSNSIGEDSWNVSAVVPSIDAAPVSASFTPLEVIGTEAKVIISWFHHPCHFFCQIADSQDQFKTMMEEIQEFYKNRKSELSVVGAPVIGLFPEDNVLYRAQVLEIIGTNYKVYYVDFGNVSTIQKIWPIDKKFMNLPAQALVCSLNGIAPLGDNWSDPDSFSQYFEKENFTCCFINKDEEKTYVNILYETEDIAQLLIRDGLAVSTLSVIPDIEIPLLLNQQFRAVLKSVNNLSDIIIALECGLAVSCSMHNLETATETFEDELRGLLEQTVIIYVDNVIDDRLEITLYDTEGNKIVVLNPDEGAIEIIELPCPMLVLHSTITGYIPFADQSSVFIQPLEYSELVEYLLEQLFATYNDQPQEFPICPEEGLLYAVHSEDTNWYRGRVLSFDDEKATVCFVDYGNSEAVAFSELRELTTSFLEISILCLQVTISSDATAFIDKEVTGNIFYGEVGWEGTIDIIESSATESAQIDDFGDTGYTSSSLEKPDNVHDINESSTYIADEAVAEVAHTNDNLGVQDETSVPNIDEKAEFENVIPIVEDGEVQQHLDKEAEVENVVATIEDGDMQQHLDEKAEVENVVVTLENGEIQQQLDEKAEIENVLPTMENGGIQQHLDEEAEVENEVPTVEDGEIQQHLDESVAIGTPVYTSHVDTPNEFYLQFHDAVAEIDDLQDGIQTGVPEWSVIENPSAGIICAAPYSGDQKWYRAVILDADDDITTVRFMDFGNTDVIDNKTTQIKMLPPNLLSLAVYATRCSLKLEPLDEEWSTNATAVFEELATNGNVTAEFLDQDEKTNYVELYSDGINIREELIQRKLAVTSTQTEETKSTGFVSHLNSPSEFWIQLENCVDELEWIAEQLSSAESFDELEDLAPGTLCAALFPDDHMWYRARILSNTVAGIELLFIDYGNSCTSSSLRQLPEDLVVTAPLAQKCSLQKPEGIPSWSPEAASKFREISAEGQTIFTVKKISTGETSIVQLFIDEEDVSTMLLPDTEEGYVKAVDSLERLQIEKADGESLEGSFQLEAMSSQELNEKAEQNFEQINKQGTTLFQIEFINSNTVRLYLNGYDIRPQLGGMKNTSFDSSEINSNEEVKTSEEQTDNDVYSICETKSGSTQDNVEVLDKLHSNVDSLEMKTDSDENRLFEEPPSDSLYPCVAASSSELVEEPVIVDQIEASPSVERDHLKDAVHLPVDLDVEPIDITSTEETESHYSIQDNSQTLNISQCQSLEASTIQHSDRIERSTQTDEGECEIVKLSEIPEESEIVESPKECSPVSSSAKSTAENLNQEQQHDETLQHSFLTMNTGEYEPLISTASPEGLDVNESPKKSSPIEVISISSVNSPVESSSQEFENDDIVQDSFQISNNIEYEPHASTASLEEAMLEESTSKSSPVEDFTIASPVKTSVADSSQTTTSENKSPTSTTAVEDISISSVISPVASLNQEFQNDDTLEDNFQTLNNIQNEPQTYTSSLEEFMVEEVLKRSFPFEDFTVSSLAEPLVPSYYQESQNDDHVQEPHSCTASPEKSVINESQNKSSLVECTTASAVKSLVACSNYDIQNDDIVQDSPDILNRDEESTVEESLVKSFSIEDTTVSGVKSPVALEVSDPTNSHIEPQVLDLQEFPVRFLFDNMKVGSSSQNIQDNDDMQLDIGGESVISQEKSLEDSPKIHFADHYSLEIEASLEESTNNTLSEAGEIDDSFNALAQFQNSTECESSLISPEKAQKSSTEMDITISPNLTVSSSIQGNDTTCDTVQTLRDTDIDDYSESQELFAETKLSEYTIGEQTSQELFKGQLYDEKEKDDRVPVDECSAIKPSEIRTDEVTPTPKSGECISEGQLSKKNDEKEKDDRVPVYESSITKPSEIQTDEVTPTPESGECECISEGQLSKKNDEKEKDNRVPVDESSIIKPSEIQTDEDTPTPDSGECISEGQLSNKNDEKDKDDRVSVDECSIIKPSEIQTDEDTPTPETSEYECISEGQLSKKNDENDKDDRVSVDECSIIKPSEIQTDEDTPTPESGECECISEGQLLKKNDEEKKDDRVPVDESSIIKPSEIQTDEDTPTPDSGECISEGQLSNKNDEKDKDDRVSVDECSIIKPSEIQTDEDTPTPETSEYECISEGQLSKKNDENDKDDRVSVDECSIIKPSEIQTDEDTPTPESGECECISEGELSKKNDEKDKDDRVPVDESSIIKPNEIQTDEVTPTPESGECISEGQLSKEYDEKEKDDRVPVDESSIIKPSEIQTDEDTPTTESGECECISEEQLSKENDEKEKGDRVPVDECSIIKPSEIQTDEVTPTPESGECEFISKGQLSKKNDEKEKDDRVPVDECSIIKPSKIQTDAVTPTPESGECEISSSSSKQVKKSSRKPVVGKDAKEPSNKSSAEKVVTVPPVKSSIRVSLSVAKLLASKKDEISSPATIPKKSKQASSPKVTTVSKTLTKQTSVKVEVKSSQKKSLIRTSSEPIKKSPSVKDDSLKKNAPGKAKTLGLSKKNSSSNGSIGPGTSKKGVIKKEVNLDLAVVLKTSCEEIPDTLENTEVKTSVIDAELEEGKISTECVHSAEENTSATNILASDQIRQDEDTKTEKSEVESSSLHSDLKEIKSVEDIEQEKKLS